MESPRKRPIGNIVISLGMTALLFVVLEMATAHYMPTILTYHDVMNNFSKLYPVAYSDYLAFTLPANTTMQGEDFGLIQTNAFGYRSHAPTQLEKPVGTRRVLFLGDSITLGWGVNAEESFTGILQAEWSQDNIEVINAAYRAGSAPDSFYAYLKREGLALDPDVLVVVICLENDTEDIADNVWVSTDETGAPLALYSIRSYPNYKGELLNPDILSWNYRVPVLNNSRFFIAITTVLTRVISPQHAPQREGRFGISLDPTTAWQRMETVIRATDKLAKEKNIPLLFIAIPTPGKTASDYPINDDLEQLIVDELQLPYLKTYDFLKPEHRIQREGDGHLNIEGNQVMAEAVQKFVSPFILR